MTNLGTMHPVWAQLIQGLDPHIDMAGEFPLSNAKTNFLTMSASCRTTGYDHKEFDHEHPYTDYIRAHVSGEEEKLDKNNGNEPPP